MLTQKQHHPKSQNAFDKGTCYIVAKLSTPVVSCATTTARWYSRTSGVGGRLRSSMPACARVTLDGVWAAGRLAAGVSASPLEAACADL